MEIYLVPAGVLEGTVKVIDVPVHVAGVNGLPAKMTVPCEVPKLAPDIVTDALTGAGLVTPVILGVGVTVTPLILLLTEFTSTEM